MGDLPVSQKRRRRSWLAPIWFVPVLAAGAVGYLIYREVHRNGPTIEIEFKQAKGLEEEKTDLRYRGVKVGEVKKLRLNKEMTRVIAEVELEKSASALARRGAEFWIVSPRISPAGIEALGSIVSGAYIGSLPGKGPKEDHFEALDQPPPLEAGQRALEIVLLSPRGAIPEDAPVLYHDIKVGAVAGSSLTEDARQVRTRVFIERPYGRLVRTNSQFWNASGLKVHWGLLSGLDVHSASLSTIVEGGVQFATPDQPGPEAKSGDSFVLAAKPKEEWKQWNPAIKLGDQPPVSER